MQERNYDQMHIRLAKSLKQRVEQAAEREERSLNSWVVLAIKEKLKRDKTQQNTD
ncbi:toxin-antitoxin system HicB family antitoxin [Endozoicomonas montiporae]|uniref:Arc-like DNA binding domain-containing protein n=1 Tax=Endozoicomonas montiporae CL-33 TaxID=570277 RepID=A0A142BB41_9GAMM|nr:toxin-antitoxin system HicB family antitoxin [Endozoicomonas montiporae]AMO55967.1 hypothetical protein EZMO1_1824 [Endozoicomonas montiporae CL-33]